MPVLSISNGHDSLEMWLLEEERSLRRRNPREIDRVHVLHRRKTLHNSHTLLVTWRDKAENLNPYLIIHCLPVHPLRT